MPPVLPLPLTPVPDVAPSTWEIYVRDPGLGRVALIDAYTSLEMTPKFNAVGSWKLTMDRRAPGAAALFQPGYGIEVTRDGDRFLAGPMTEPTAARDEDSFTASIVGVDDMVWLTHRQAHPQPGSAAPPYATAEYDVRTGVCSTVLAAYVDANGGPGAVPQRQIPGLVLGTDPVAGDTVTGRARWQVLLDLLAELATAGGGLGFDMVQIGGQLQFAVWEPVDRSGEVTFSEGLGTLASYTLARKAPTSTFVYVGGGGEGTARVVVEQEGPDAATGWGRRESFVDSRDTSDPAELAQKAGAELTSAAESLTLGAVPIESAQMRYGTHYSLGDRVSLTLDDGSDTVVSELVRQVEVKLTPGSQRLTPVIGTPGTRDLLRLAGSFRDLSSRVRDLERR